MVKHKYGAFKTKQVREIKETMRKQIFFLLLLADPKTKGQYPDVDIKRAFDNFMYKINGFNSLLSYPAEIVEIFSILESAREELDKPEFDFDKYRKLVLDAGAQVSKIKEV
ncbi:MAG: hypothetical protein LIR46_03335 [Bacteroidota bacterium]|nr:hypothetical protein [Bacteroidota bacterium]